jgi:hypothetical protein
MGEELTYFSTEEADTKFLNLFVITATSTLETGNYDKANTLYSNLGEAWYEAEQGLAAMSAAEGAHEPAEESSLEADLKFAVEDSLKLLWDAIKPKLRVRRVPLNMPAIEAAYSKFATVAAVQAAKGQRAAGSEGRAGADELPMGSFLDKLTARMNGTQNGDDAVVGEPQPGKGNGTPERAPAVSEKLKHAAARLLVPGPPPLRQDERWGPSIALHMLQEKSSLSDWVDHLKLSGHNDREARTIARALELGVNEYGAGYLASKPAEVSLRRLLAICIAAKGGSTAQAWRAASLLEDLPGDGLLAVLPVAVHKKLREELKQDLQLEHMLSGKLPPKKQD